MPNKTDKRKGVKYGLRKQSETKANQWTGTRQQEEFLMYYLDPQSPSFGNAYQSALESGYSEDYARIISAPSVGRLWIKEARNLVQLGPEHISQALQKEAMNPLNKGSERIQALTVLAKLQGLFVDKKIVAHTTIEDALNMLEDD